MKKYVPIVILALLTAGCSSSNKGAGMPQQPEGGADHKKSEQHICALRSKEQLKKELSPEEYHVMWEKGTERAFTGELLDNKKPGVYVCKSCKNELFDSQTKFDSGTGWPSFYQPAKEASVGTKIDESHNMTRVEVHCARCGAHLGHVFPDGPNPTGMRYCINSVSLDFEEKK